jgi:hypothetical protein
VRGRLATVPATGEGSPPTSGGDRLTGGSGNDSVEADSIDLVATCE